MTFDTNAARSQEPHSAIVRAAVLYASGKMSPDEANAFEERVRTELRFRQIALGKLAAEHLPRAMVARATSNLRTAPRGLDYAREQVLTQLATRIQLAFEAQFPTLEQLELRDRAWFESPYRKAFPGIDVVTMESRRNGMRVVKTPRVEERGR